MTNDNEGWGFCSVVPRLQFVIFHLPLVICHLQNLSLPSLVWGAAMPRRVHTRLVLGLLLIAVVSVAQEPARRTGRAYERAGPARRGTSAPKWFLLAL